MRALYLKDSLEFKELPKPEPREHEALVKVLKAGICNTDLELLKGYMGFEGVLGHEFVGIVEQAAATEWVGKRICGEINFGCGECDVCRRGLSRHCPNRTVLGILNQNGAFADYVTIPIANLNEVPNALSNEVAAFVEPVAAALEIPEQIQIEPNQRVAVIGDGKLGLLICQVLQLTGCDLRLIGKHRSKLQRAEALGIRTHSVEDLPERQFDIVVEVSGSASGFETAMQLVRPRGTIVLKSTYHGTLEVNAAPIVIDEISIVGSRCGQFAPAIRLLERKLIDVEPLIDAEYTLEDFEEAFRQATQSDSLKILLQINA